MSPPKYVDLWCWPPRSPSSCSAAGHARLRGGRRRLARPARFSWPPRAAPARAGRRQPPEAMGVLAATLGRVWLMATLGPAGRPAERQDGLAAAILVARTVHGLARRPGPATLRAYSRARQGRGVKTGTKVLIGVGALLGFAILMLLLRQRRQERRIQAAERVQARAVGHDQDRRHRPQHQQGGPLPVPGQRADDRHHGLDLAAHAAEAEPGADDVEVAYDLTRNNITGGNIEEHRLAARGFRSWRRSSSSSGSRT